MTLTDSSLADGFRVAGLAARRRDLRQIAYVWTMSNGALARPMGKYGRLLVPFSGTFQLLIAAGLLPVLVRQPAAAAAVKPPDGKYRADPVALAGAFIAFSLTWIIYSLALALLLPLVAYATVMIALLAVVFADVGGGVGLNLIRQRRRKVPSLTKTTASLDAVSVSCVAAFPRGGGRGTTLMSAVHAVLDDHALTALLDARPQISRRLPPRSDSAVWYDSLGYRATGTWRRMARHPGCNTASPPRQS